MKRILLCILTLALAFENDAQPKASKTKNLLGEPLIHRCGTYEKIQELRALDPVGFDKNKIKQEQFLQNWISNHSQNNNKAKVIYTIPVVVQIFGTTPNNSVTDNRVYEQIDVLTKDYRRLNSDSGNTPSPFKSLAADCEIEFCLATIDPQGNATTGIVRKTGSTSPTTSDLWNTSQYLNLLVYSIGGGTLGFTYLPSSAPNNGVHIGYQYFGKTGASAPFNKGRTATHEVGHWFNLEHIWGDANCGNDNVSDTPTQQSENYNCPSFPSTSNCTGNAPNGDMFMNYMDYTDDGCMNMFSAGQKSRMIAAINQWRPGLLNNGKCGTANPVPPTADFSASQTTISVGTCVNFSDLSSGLPTSWSWAFQGAGTSVSSLQNPSNICYNDTGCYDVTLIAINADGSDTLTKSCYINVIPLGDMVCDTVSNYKSTDTPTLLGSGGWGYVTGHNDYDDRGKAEFFSALPPSYEIVGAKFWFAKAYSGSTGGTVDIKIWSDNAGVPGAQIYSQTVPISQLSIYPQETMITFSTPQSVSGNYYLGVEFSANGAPQDTIALISNADGETSPGTGWELWSDGVWHPISEPNTGWGINLSMGIWAIRCPVDSNSCNINGSTAITNPACGQTDGSITVTANGGTSPFTYLWNNGQTGQTATGLGAGNYSVDISDANGCTQTIQVSLSSAGAPIPSAIITDASCYGGNDGSVTVTVTGGTSPYSYNWSNGATTPTISNLTAGSYSGTVTDANGCQSSGVADVSEPTVITGTVTSSNASCGNTNGTAVVSGSGGTPGYSYLWSNGQTGATATGLAAGNYLVTITDSKNCTASVVGSVSNTNAPLIVPGSVDASSFGACDGSASVGATGGVTPYTYLWSNGATTSGITGLCAGTYNVTVTDGAGCVATSSIIVSQPVGLNGLLPSEKMFQIYPNPGNGIFSINIPESSNNSPVLVSVYNVLGKRVKIHQAEPFGSRVIILDLSSESRGVYFVQVSSDRFSGIKKISLIK